MARRRRSRLAGSPEHHLAQAEKGVGDVLAYAAEVHDQIKAGRCAGAYDAMREAVQHATRVSVHASESGRSRANLELSQEYAYPLIEAIHAVKARCLVARPKKTGLAGMRRRRSR